MFWKTSKHSSLSFYEYEDIPLKIYLAIIKTGDFTKLVKEGECDSGQYLEAWERIVKKQAKETGSNQYNSLLQLLKGYALIVNDHTLIRACLVLLTIGKPNEEYIAILKSKGYNIDVNNYRASLEASFRKCENLVTKAVMKKKELERMFEGKESEGETKGFEEVLANLNFALGFTVEDTITLARYNEYQKILKAKQKTIKEAHGRNK